MTTIQHSLNEYMSNRGIERAKAHSKIAEDAKRLIEKLKKTALCARGDELLNRLLNEDVKQSKKRKKACLWMEKSGNNQWSCANHTGDT